MYYDRASNVCYLSIRGTSEFARDVIGGDIGGMVGVFKDRIEIIKQAFDEKISALKAATCCEVVLTGHSLGGSEASALATVMDVNLVVTANAPELVHYEDIEKSSNRRATVPQVHVRLEGDVVSQLRSGSCRSFDDRKGITIPSVGLQGSRVGPLGVLEAHKISLVLDAITALLQIKPVGTGTAANDNWAVLGI
jgi:hypothetical protein